MISDDVGARIASPPPVSRARPVNVLIVEDNPATARALTELLESNGYRVSAAEDGSTAKTLLDEVQPDHVHILVGGRIVASGGMELAAQLERDGYEAFR